jgi:hypothetical protein
MIYYHDSEVWTFAYRDRASRLCNRRQLRPGLALDDDSDSDDAAGIARGRSVPGGPAATPGP